MAKFAPYSRRTLRVRRRAWVRRNLAPLSGLALMAATMIAGSVVFARAVLETPVGWYLLGCFHLALIGVLLYLSDVAFMASDREAIQHVRGAWGEDNTRNELQIARRRRLVWGWVDSITMEVGDIDHVVVTRSGGVVAIDSKWRNAIDRRDIEQMARSARRAASRAEGLGGQLLRTQERSKPKHRSKSRPLNVTPVVVVWGAAQHDLPQDAAHDGVRFIAGLDLRRWLSDQHHDPIDRAAARHFLSALKDWRATAWAANVS